jgi:hypothetical protein
MAYITSVRVCEKLSFFEVFYAAKPRKTPQKTIFPKLKLNNIFKTFADTILP